MNSLYRIRYLLLLLVGVACAAHWPGAKVAVEADYLSAWFLQNDPTLAAFHDFQIRCNDSWAFG